MTQAIRVRRAHANHDCQGTHWQISIMITTSGKIKFSVTVNLKATLGPGGAYPSGSNSGVPLRLTVSVRAY